MSVITVDDMKARAAQADFYANLASHDPPSEYLQIIGSISIRWGRIEAILTERLILESRVEDGIGNLLVAPMDGTTKFSRLISILKFRNDPVWESYSAVFKACGGAKSTRNILAHWCYMGFDEETDHVFFCNNDAPYIRDDGKLAAPIRAYSLQALRRLDYASKVILHVIVTGRPPDDLDQSSVDTLAAEDGGDRTATPHP
ncbi:hypothetical protein B5K08_21810 [Rhizobium leguminosarum bv. trifolii]|uniref:Uncharacterized protein n=1 Tax=Rhizobium leguminosarum bv. trifolii TaxID=386 RepID=A0A3E1B9M1_RHILT|nr:hypothetical protein [Rhizobium leguminosarum]RFB87917.1 hypothetical protein B5K08_21810 [Rhizobium leguminosarum bv. trifolii]RFB88158.1 hypothetical protein B5K10_21805 [Rhizobium leguminosarum bv. trifolii]